MKLQYFITFFILFLHSSILHSKEVNFPDEFDFIIVGAGAGGAPVAARLAEIDTYKVLLLEAGKRPPRFNSIPYFSAGPFKGEFDWDFLTEKQTNCCQGFIDQKWPWPRGKGLGGSTIINSMAYSRGHRKDYDHWKALGNEGWSYEDVLPYFKKMEDYRGPILDEADWEYHGRKGPVVVSTPPFRTPVADIFLEAGKELGYSHIDYNAKEMTGFANPVFTINNGTRCSSYVAYLRSNKNKNLHILTEAFVTKILFNDHKKAVAVLFERDGVLWKVKSHKEIILSAGSVQSPQLLMLSGIGPKDILEKFHIPIVAELPGVGRNLKDHVSVAGVLFTIDKNVGFDRTTDVLPETMELWEMKRQGPLTVPVRGEGIAFLNSKYISEDYPDYELQFFQTPGNRLGLDPKKYRKAFGYKDDREMFLIHPILLRPKSVGHIRLKSADPHDHPRIQPHYMSHPYDHQVLQEAVETSIKLMQTTAFKKLGVKWHNRTFPSCEDHVQFSKQFWKCYLSHYSFGFYHPSGTCKMGPQKDKKAVVDSRLRVYGVKRLRVIDLSISPTIVSGHTMPPSIMIGEKGAAMILEDWSKHRDEL